MELDILNIQSEQQISSRLYRPCKLLSNSEFAFCGRYYSGHESPSLKMGSFWGGSTSGLMLIGWHAANMSSVSSGKERNVDE